MMKKLIVGAAVAAMALAAPMSAFAATATCSVGEDGGCVAVAKSSRRLSVRSSSSAWVSSKTIAVSDSSGGHLAFVDDGNHADGGDSRSTANSTNVVNTTVIVVGSDY